MAKPSGEKLIVDNRRARHDYHLSDRVEAGVVLQGTEVKSLRGGQATLQHAYAEVRDRRMELTDEEGQLKARAIALMHQFKKTIYKHDGIEIRLVAGAEDVKVKVRKAPDDADDDVEITEAHP